LPPVRLRDLAHVTGQDTIPLTRLVTAIGRHPDSDIVLNSEDVSIRHAVIEYRTVGNGRKFFLQDLRSSNGSTHNGRPFSDPDRSTEVELRHRDKFTLADCAFEFVNDAEIQLAPTRLAGDERRAPVHAVAARPAAGPAATVLIGKCPAHPTYAFVEVCAAGCGTKRCDLCPPWPDGRCAECARKTGRAASERVNG